MGAATAERRRMDDLRQCQARTRRYSSRIVGTNRGRQRLRDNPLVGLVCSRASGKDPTVPLDAMRNSEPERPEPQTREEGENSVAIAVVDDDAAVLDSTRVLLEALDFEVHTYGNAADFLAANPKTACVIADYHMPGMNGLDLAAELRNRGNTIPVIMITAMSDPQIETRAAALGIRAVLKKPLGKALAAAVKNELG